VIAERGVAGTRLADVAERIGVSPPAVLYWFDSKEQLLAEALVADEDRYYNALGVRLAELPDPADRLGLLISSAAGGASEFALWLELWAWSLRDEELREARERLDHRWRGEIERIVRDGQAAGTFADVDAEDAALAIASLLDGLMVQVRLDECTTAERMVEVAVLVTGRLLGCDLPRQPLVSVEEMLAGIEAGAEA
jgi:AcrR family transcriptional regulator